MVGAILSGAGLFFVVLGILQADNDAALMTVLLVTGVAFLVAFFLLIRARACGQRSAPVEGAIKNRTSNLGRATQNIRWLLLMCTSFTVAVFLQTVRGYDAMATAVVCPVRCVGDNLRDWPERRAMNQGARARWC